MYVGMCVQAVLWWTMNAPLALFCWCVSWMSQTSDACWRWCNGQQSGRQGSSPSAGLMITRKPSHHNRPVSRSRPSLICTPDCQRHWLICPNLLMLSPQLQTQKLTPDDGVSQVMPREEWLFSYTVRHKSDAAAWGLDLFNMKAHLRQLLLTELQIQNTTAAGLPGDYKATVICTDPSIGSRGLSAIIQSR